MLLLFFLFVAMAPKKDLADFATQEALTEKTAEKRKRPAQAAEEKEFLKI